MNPEELCNHYLTEKKKFKSISVKKYIYNYAIPGHSMHSDPRNVPASSS